MLCDRQFPAVTSATSSSGNPGCSIQLFMIRVDRQFRSRFQCLPEIIACGAPVGMRFQIPLQAGLEMILSDISVNLPQDAAALAVDDRRGAGIDDDMLSAGDFDGKIFDQGIPGHGHRGLAIKKLVPDAPVRVIMIHDAITEIRGKAFIQPQIFPVRRGDQIAEPLVHDFMGDDFTDSALPGFRCNARIPQQQVLPKRDGPPVLHGAESKVRNGDQIQLGKRIGNAEIFFAECQRIAPEIQAESRHKAPFPAVSGR